MTRFVPHEESPAWALLPVLLVVILCCGGAMLTTGADNRCTTAGGQLRFALALPLGYHCVREGHVINP